MATGAAAAEPRFRARDIRVAVPGLAGTTTCGAVVERFLAHPDLPCLAVVDDEGRPVGVVERERLLSTFADRIKSELYRRRPVAAVAEPVFLAVDAATGLDDVSATIAGEHPRALANGFVVTEDGRYTGIGTGIALLSAVVDLTRDRAGQLAAAGVRATAASRAKSAFVAAMSHEIRTPLHGVIGSLELLRHADDPAERDELVGSATVAAQTLLRIIGDVLDFSKIESDRITLEIADLDPAALLRETAGLFAAEARRRGVALRVHVGTGVPPVIRGDALRLRQVVMNLIGNAVKFTGSGTIAVSLTRIWHATDRPRLRLCVADTGPGFAAAAAATLFDAFVQENGATTRRYGGSGLGLAIASRLVALMGGTIAADGAPGEGASFWCELPVDAPAGEPVPATVPPPDLHGLDVLLFDGGRPDQGGNGNRGAAPLIEAAGGRVVLADGLLAGITALRRAAAAGSSFGVVVLDAHLPDGDRFVVAELLAGSPATLVLAVPDDEPALARAAYRRGFALTVATPCPPAEIVAAIAAAAGRTGAAPPPAAVPEGAVPEGAVPASLAHLSGGRPVLVIDDTPMNLAMARRQLQRLGLVCDVAADGREGLRLATAGDYALILVDRAMPGLDGPAFARRLRAWEAPRGRRTPIVALTAHAQPEDVQVSRDAGMDDHLTKPVTLDRLAASLARWLPSGDAPAAGGKPAGGKPPVDLAALAAALGGAERAEMVEILEVFVATFPALLQRIGTALDCGDRDALEAAAHAAKGAAGNAAAGALAAALATLEADARDAAADRLRGGVAGAAARFAAVAGFVDRLRDQDGAATPSIHSSATPS